jgi:hypothetical protein
MRDPTPESAFHAELPDDTLLVFLSDVHIGGAAGTEIFQSPAELMALLENLGRHPGPVELVLAGDFLDLLRMGDVGRGEDEVAATIARPEYHELFAAVRAFAQGPEHRVVYVVGNHDAEVWWNPQIQRSLRQAGLVDVFALSYVASFASQPERLVYCEHGNQFDPSNTLVDYANPLDSPVGAHVVTELVRPIGSGIAVTRSVDLGEVSYVFPLAAIPQWVAGRIFYRFLGQVLPWLLAPLVAVYLAYEGLVALVRAFGESLALRSLFLEVAYVLGLLAVAFPVVFLISRRTTARDLHHGGPPPRAGTGPGAVSRGRGHPRAPGGRSSATDGRNRLPHGDRGVRLRPHPRPRHVGAGTSRRTQDGDRQPRLLAAPTAADRGAAATARGPGRGRPRSAEAPLSRRLGGCHLTVGLRPGPISLLAGTAAMGPTPGPELMVHFVGGDLGGWLLGHGLVALVGVAAWAQRNLRIRQFADEERDLPLALVARHWYRAALAAVVTAHGLLGWLLYKPLGLDSAELAVAAAGLVGVVAIIASSVPMWNQILRYARGEPLGTDPSGRASRTEPPR